MSTLYQCADCHTFTTRSGNIYLYDRATNTVHCLRAFADREFVESLYRADDAELEKMMPHRPRQAIIRQL